MVLQDNKEVQNQGNSFQQLIAKRKERMQELNSLKNYGYDNIRIQKIWIVYGKEN